MTLFALFEVKLDFIQSWNFKFMIYSDVEQEY